MVSCFQQPAFLNYLSVNIKFLRTADVVGLYLNSPHEEGLIALRKRLDLRQEKDFTASALVELAEVVLKSNIFTFKEKALKQK